MANRLFCLVAVSILVFCVVGFASTADDDNAPKNGNKKTSQNGGASQLTKRSDFLKESERLQSNLDALDISSEAKVPLRTQIQDFVKRLKANSGTLPELTRDEVGQYQKIFNQLSAKYLALRGSPEVVTGGSPNTSAPTSPSTPMPEATRGKDDDVKDDWVSWLWYLLGWAVILIPTLVLITGVAWMISRFVRETRGAINGLGSDLSDTRRKSKVLSEKLDSMGQAITGLSQQVTQQKAELNRLKQSVGDQPAGVYQPPPSPVAEYPIEPPRFPAAVTDYLAKFGSSASMVKFDYREGILVSDPAGEGGLAIVQDDGQSVLVPSFGFFQTKSDYTNYFERYFSCAKPGGGSVWIRQPAVVSKVDGGWTVTQNGELEVR